MMCSPAVRIARNRRVPEALHGGGEASQSLQSARQAQFRLRLRRPLQAAKKGDDVQVDYGAPLPSWLGHYSLATDAGCKAPSRDPVATVERNGLKRQTEIESQKAVLSYSEKADVGTMFRNVHTVDLATLIALRLS